MAACGHDMVIDLYRVADEYLHYARCKGHSACVLHLDFSSDGKVLQSSCNAYELLYWDVQTGSRIAQEQRNRYNSDKIPMLIALGDILAKGNLYVDSLLSLVGCCIQVLAYMDQQGGV